MDKHADNGIAAFLLIIVLLIFLVGGICFNKIGRFSEKFTAPGLTLTKPPSWFPQNAAKPYNKNDWRSRMYLDRYPFRYNNKGENCQTTKYDDVSHIPDSDYISTPEANHLASTYRMWRI
jgi:hypothetical protein